MGKRIFTQNTSRGVDKINEAGQKLLKHRRILSSGEGVVKFLSYLGSLGLLGSLGFLGSLSSLRSLGSLG